MTVTAVRKDPETLTMTLTAEFDASPERVWDLWADPRKLERWWGPPTYPATFTAHDLAPGSRVEYHMTGPSGDQPHGYWDVVEVDPPRRLVFVDGFANEDGTPNDDFPRNEGRVTIEPIAAGRTRMSIQSRFPSTEAMEQVLAMGMEEGLTQAVGQIDAILAEDGVRSCVDRDKQHRRHLMTTMTEPTTRTLDAPGATLTYDVRKTDSAAPPLVLIGSPMGAGGFVTLAGHFPDRTIVTYDPRGVERSVKADPATQSTPQQHADDLHRIIDEVGGGPVDLFASSGGAVNALALVAAHPEQVRTLVAHEPPLASILPDREGAMAFTQAIADTYQRSGFGPAMAQFILAVSHKGPDDPRVRRPAGARSGDVRPARRGRRHPHRPAALPEHHDVHPLRARLRRVASGLDPDRAGRRRGVGRRDGAPRRGGRRPATRHATGHLPERPRWLPRRRVRSER